MERPRGPELRAKGEKEQKRRKGEKKGEKRAESTLWSMITILTHVALNSLLLIQNVSDMFDTRFQRLRNLRLPTYMLY